MTTDLESTRRAIHGAHREALRFVNGLLPMIHERALRLDEVDDCIFLKDRFGKMRYQNAAFTRTFGHGRDQTGNCGSVFLPERIRNLAKTTDSIVVAFNQPVHFAFTMEGRDSQLKTFETIKIPLISTDCRTSDGVVGVARELSTEIDSYPRLLINAEAAASLFDLHSTSLPDAVQRSVGQQINENDDRLCLLTTRQLLILRLIARGFKNRDVAHELGVSLRTVEKHRQTIRQRLGVGSFAEILRIVSVSSLDLSSSESEDEC